MNAESVSRIFPSHTDDAARVTIVDDRPKAIEEERT